MHNFRSSLTLEVLFSLIPKQGVAQILLFDETIINLNLICKYKFQNKSFSNK